MNKKFVEQSVLSVSGCSQNKYVITNFSHRTKVKNPELMNMQIRAKSFQVEVKNSPSCQIAAAEQLLPSISPSHFWG